MISKEDIWFVAHCVELGVVSHGKTIEEVLFFFGVGPRKIFEIYFEMSKSGCLGALNSSFDQEYWGYKKHHDLIS